MAVYNWIYTTLSYGGLELVTFVLVDAVVKTPLRDAASDGEKRTIWLYESVGLSLMCFLVYVVHHVPYLLILLTCITFVYTQLLIRAGLSNILADIQAHWENHLQHEESMKLIERQKHLQQQQQQNLGIPNFPAADISNLSGQNIDHNYGLTFPFMNKQNNLQYPPNATVVPGQDTPTYSLKPNTIAYRDGGVKHGRGVIASYARNWNSAAPAHYSNINTQHALQSLNSAPLDSGVTSLHSINLNNCRPFWSNQNLHRRSLHPDLGTKMLVKAPPSRSIKSKVMNIIGLGPSAVRPVGLVNSGENLCFMNSIVQCLARSPFLVENLTAIAAKELECSVFESELLSSLTELLDNLTLPPEQSLDSVASVAKFRQACSNLQPQLVTPPGQHMAQQDAAEFLMWLLATVHSILNKNRRALESDLANEERFASARLADLKLIYGDLTACRVQELMEQCRKDIAAANGLENESYAEAIQRLSDLEWLVYKQANDTVIDSLFTGQLVEAYYGVNHGGISVNLQTFNVLPVPIGDAGNFSGLVMLDDCFTRFCNIESLVELSTNSPDHLGVKIDQQPTRHMSYVPRHRALRRVGTVPVALNNFQLAQESPYLPSPIHPTTIPLQAVSSRTAAPFISQTYSISPAPQSFMRDNLVNDSGFLDNTFRTSTPVLRDNIGSPRQWKIERRCLLRQLPECLIIQLMRFRYDHVTRSATKMNTSVSIRLRDFNLRHVIYDTVMQRSDMTAPNTGYVYELYGVCLHLGGDSTSHGHYVSYCLDSGRWYRMDDQNVLEVNMEYQLNHEEIRQNAYILFYRRTTACS